MSVCLGVGAGRCRRNLSAGPGTAGLSWGECRTIRREFEGAPKIENHVTRAQLAEIRAGPPSWERWTPCFGQVFVTAKVESGFMIQAAFGWPEVGRSPRLRSASALLYASSGVRPLSDEWGRHRL